MLLLLVELLIWGNFLVFLDGVWSLSLSLFWVCIVVGAVREWGFGVEGLGRSSAVRLKVVPGILVGYCLNWVGGRVGGGRLVCGFLVLELALVFSVALGSCAV